MFHSLFLNLFNVKMSEAGAEDNPGGGGPGTEVPPGTDVPPGTTDVPPEGSDVPPGDAEVPPGKETPNSEDTPDPVFFYGDSEVTIDIPDDITADLESKGLNAKELAADLYREGGNFELSPENREKADKAFGKWAVDAFLGSLKTQNDSFIKGIADDKAAHEKADADRFTTLLEPFGGDDGWTALSTWGNENLSPEQVDDLNAVMQSGNLGVQRYALQMLANQKRAAEGDPEAVLITGNAPEANGGGALNALDYRDAMIKARADHKRDPAGYEKAVSGLDARRRAGMAKGM